MIQDLTEKALAYALIGTTFRVYAWTVFSIFLFLLFKKFNELFKNENIKTKYHYLFLIGIPLGLLNAVIYTLNLDAPKGVLFVDVIVFILGIILLIGSLLIYDYLKRRKG